MAISFNCESCKKRINAPDGAGGKYGKCPHCNHRCYIPLPRSEGEEELKLAPIDPKEETEYEKKMRETREIQRRLLHERDEPK